MDQNLWSCDDRKGYSPEDQPFFFFAFFQMKQQLAMTAPRIKPEMPHSDIPIMSNFTLHVCAKISMCQPVLVLPHLTHNFKSACKCMYGVICEPFSCQFKYLIDEDDDPGKEASVTFSVLDSFLNNHGIHEAHLSLYPDNCVRKNNNIFMHCVSWHDE